MRQIFYVTVLKNVMHKTLESFADLFNFVVDENHQIKY